MSNSKNHFQMTLKVYQILSVSCDMKKQNRSDAYHPATAGFSMAAIRFATSSDRLLEAAAAPAIIA